MSPSRDDVQWIQRGRQRAAVATVLQKPMTSSEICRAAAQLAPRIQLRDVWLIVQEMRDRHLVSCLNPRHVTGKLHVLSERGRHVVQLAFGRHSVWPDPQVDWHRYAMVVRARLRKIVLLQLYRQSPEEPVTATAVRKRVNVRHPVGLNPVVRALKELEKLRLVRALPAGGACPRKIYILTQAGERIAAALERKDLEASARLHGVMGSSSCRTTPSDNPLTPSPMSRSGRCTNRSRASNQHPSR